MTLFRSREDQARFDADGYVVLDLLDAHAVAQCRALFDEAVGETRHPDLYESSRNLPLDANVRINERLREEFRVRWRACFDAGSILFGGTFMVKAPRSSTLLPLHQDWSIVEEDRFQSAFLWCALGDVPPEAGGLFVIPGSHRLFDNYRSGSMPSVRIPPSAPFSGLVVDVPLRAGQAIAWSDRLFHGSHPNLTPHPRVVCSGRVNEAGSRLVYYQQAPEPGRVDVVAASPDFYLRSIDQLAKGGLPESCEVVRVLEYEHQPVTGERLLAGLRASASRAG